MAIVTIARSVGSGGEDTGKAVASKLGYEYIGKNRILGGVKIHGEKWLEWGRELDEHGPSPWERFDRSFTGFVAMVESSIYAYALEDNKVISGRGGNFLLKDVPYALRVLVTGSPEGRSQRVSDREHVNLETARRMIAFGDHERMEYLTSVYHRDPLDPAEYDAVFDTDRTGLDEVAGQIVALIPERNKNATPEAREKLIRVALAAKVKAEIISDFRMFVPTLEVVHDGKEIVVRGIVHSQKERDLLLEIAGRAAASTPVRGELHFRGA